MSKTFFYIPRDESFVRRALYRFHPSAKPVPSFPEDILFETVAGCNARCTFCPNGNGSSKIPPGRMEWDLFKKIIDESVENPVKRISPYLMNEPLLDRDLGKKINYIAKRRKNGFSIKINTNASLLDEEMGRSLAGSGIDRLNISCHGISKEAYEASMKGLSREKTLANVDNFLALLKKSSHTKPKVCVTMVKTKLIEKEIPEIRLYWRSRGVSVHIRQLENRANADIGRKGLETTSLSRYSWCKRIFTQACILTNGDMLLCCIDYGYTMVLGNVGKQSIKDIWNSEKALNMRRQFLSGKTEGLLCHGCLKQPSL